MCPPPSFEVFTDQLISINISLYRGSVTVLVLTFLFCSLYFFPGQGTCFGKKILKGRAIIFGIDYVYIVRFII